MSTEDGGASEKGTPSCGADKSSGDITPSSAASPQKCTCLLAVKDIQGHDSKLIESHTLSNRDLLQYANRKNIVTKVFHLSPSEQSQLTLDKDALPTLHTYSQATQWLRSGSNDLVTAPPALPDQVLPLKQRETYAPRYSSSPVSQGPLLGAARVIPTQPQLNVARSLDSSVLKPTTAQKRTAAKNNDLFYVVGGAPHNTPEKWTALALP
jgi:hypothetical protein